MLPRWARGLSSTTTVCTGRSWRISSAALYRLLRAGREASGPAWNSKCMIQGGGPSRRSTLSAAPEMVAMSESITVTCGSGTPARIGQSSGASSSNDLSVTSNGLAKEWLLLDFPGVAEQLGSVHFLQMWQVDRDHASRCSL